MTFTYLLNTVLICYVDFIKYRKEHNIFGTLEQCLFRVSILIKSIVGGLLQKHILQHVLGTRSDL